MSRWVCEVMVDCTDDEVGDLVRSLKATFGERVRTRTLLRSAWDLERNRVATPVLVRVVQPARPGRGYGRRLG